VLWVLNAYSLLYAVLLITSARLGDIYGPRNLLAAGIAIFTAASVLSGLAQDATQLVAARALQGVGAAVLAPQGMPLMMSIFPVEKRGAAFAAYCTAGGLAVMAGPITIPEIIAAGLAVLVLFLVYQARHQRGEPLIPFAVFKDRNFTLMTLVMAALGFAMLGVYLPLTIYLQSVLGLSAMDAGITIAAQPLAMMFASGVAAALVQKLHGKYLLIPRLLLFAAGVGYLDWEAHADSSRWSFLLGLLASGLALGFVWTPVFSIATRDLKPELAGVGSGIVNTIQEGGGVLAS